MKKEEKTVFSCQSCGYQTLKWMGRCPDCGQWDSFVEEVARSKSEQRRGGGISAFQTEPVPIDSVKEEDFHRHSTQINEFDRVLGGGLVPGSLVLIGGDPGIGKSTLMLQVLYGLAENGRRVLYVSGEESVTQVSMRSRRLGVVSSNIFVVSEIDMNSILAMVEGRKPDVLVIDSVQTMFNPEITSAPGSVSQVRETTVRLMLLAKRTGISVFLVGHVTKEGAIAGPKLLEHMVDTVLYFEGDRNHVYKILRAVKNRFGSTNEIGVFEMKEKGLQEVTNPSAAFLSERPKGSAGSVVTASMEGTRPILVELQSLVTGTSLALPRRTVLGLDHNRVSLLVAVMEKKLGMHLMGFDVFMNVAGGVTVDEPAVDMGIVSAVASSFWDIPIPEDTVVIGEIGLTGEVRAVSHADYRVAEILKMGFTRCLLPKTSLNRMPKKNGMELIGVQTISETVEVLFGR
ncbi:MAG: DNA repair protein RadA [Deltaproteobacteria bacterium RBG_13_49_15]|nr:MAG: DNA repair protein RadA [Deltaproteobacteria bacterium RBG_13_49_15]